MTTGFSAPSPPPAGPTIRGGGLLPATLAQRIYASIVDSTVMAALVYLPPWLFTLAGAGAWDPYAYVAMLVIALVLYDPLLVWAYGQTLGHRAVGIKVLRTDGGPVGFGAALWRFLLKLALGTLSFLTMMGARQLALHDMASGTQVVGWPRRPA